MSAERLQELQYAGNNLGVELDIYPRLKCPICGTEFVAYDERQVYCNHKCSGTAATRAYRKRKAEIIN